MDKQQHLGRINTVVGLETWANNNLGGMQTVMGPPIALPNCWFYVSLLRKWKKEKRNCLVSLFKRPHGAMMCSIKCQSTADMGNTQRESSGLNALSINEPCFGLTLQKKWLQHHTKKWVIKVTSLGIKEGNKLWEEATAKVTRLSPHRSRSPPAHALPLRKPTVHHHVTVRWSDCCSFQASVGSLGILEFQVPSFSFQETSQL